MDLRATRRPAAPTWVRYAERAVLPIVTLMLLVGAVFIALAYGEARDVVKLGERKDHERAIYNARATADVIDRQMNNVEEWVKARPDALDPANAMQLQRDVTQRVAPTAGSALLAWVVVRDDGSIAAIGEHEPGQLRSSGISDDLSVFGRTIAARNKVGVSDRLSFDDETVYAIGAPTRDRATKGGVDERGAVVALMSVRKGTLSAFIPEGEPSAIGAVTLLDARGRRIAGRASDADRSDDVTRAVGDIGWRVLLEHEPVELFVPLWAYPVSALLLVALAFGYVFQELTTRRYRRVGDERMQQVRTLYALASHVLHARTVREQAEYLAHMALELVPVDGARVRIAAERDEAGIVAGHANAGQREYRVAITGPRQPLGELVLYRRAFPIDAEEKSVMRTAATLVGAAIHTLDALEAERTAADELKRLDELRSNLLATVAHELRSPITAVKGVLGLLQMQDDLGNVKNREYVDVAMERTDRLVALIQDLFDCSLIETGQLDIRPEPQNAEELLNAALGAQAAARPGELILSATQNLSITVDPVRFDQLVNNLVTNAFRHGAPPIEVAVRPWTDGAMVIVSDEGPGIAPEDREQIFGKFYQGSSGHARLVEGAGLGLSLVQGLVRLHGGRVEIDSTHADGRGARFTVYFPDVTPVQEETPVSRIGRGDTPDLDLEPITRII